MAKYKLTERELRGIIRECLIEEGFMDKIKSGARAFGNFAQGGKFSDPENMSDFERTANQNGWNVTDNGDGTFYCETNVSYQGYDDNGNFRRNISTDNLAKLATQLLGQQYIWQGDTNKRWGETPDANGGRELAYGVPDIKGTLIPV